MGSQKAQASQGPGDLPAGERMAEGESDKDQVLQLGEEGSRHCSGERGHGTVAVNSDADDGQGKTRRVS